ncbi:MAG TPA: hypothetical protein VM430_08185 [Microbacterium sp.]|nr:hypothetical protein [Microbacterium sp.]
MSEELPPPKTQALAQVFDRLIDSNIQLTQSVGKLVRLTYGVLAFNAVLVAAVIVILRRLS